MSNFQPLDVVDRVSDTQHQVVKKFSFLSTLSSIRVNAYILNKLMGY